MKKEKIYKAIWLTEELHNIVKLRATKEKKTVIQFIDSLLQVKKQGK